jgi:hypothetical protein
MQCPKCEKGRLFRSKRRGLMERLFYSRVALFPWRCNLCKTRFMLSAREEMQSKADPVWTG